MLGADDTLPMPLQTATTAAAANHSPSVAVVLVQDCVCNGDLVLPWDVAQGLTGGMAAQLVHHRAAAAHPGHMLPPGFNRRDRGRQLSAFFPVLTPHPRPAEPPSAGSAATPRRGHSFARMWCELTTTAAGSFALSNFGAWLLKGRLGRVGWGAGAHVCTLQGSAGLTGRASELMARSPPKICLLPPPAVKARAGDLVLLRRTATAGGTEYMHMLPWSFVEARAVRGCACQGGVGDGMGFILSIVSMTSSCRPRSSVPLPCVAAAGAGSLHLPPAQRPGRGGALASAAGADRQGAAGAGCGAGRVSNQIFVLGAQLRQKPPALAAGVFAFTHGWCSHSALLSGRDGGSAGRLMLEHAP